MLWLKKKYSLNLSHGFGEVLSEEFNGEILQIIVTPEKTQTIWSIKILDDEGDLIFQEIDCEGVMCKSTNIPVGRDRREKLKITIFDTTSNEKFSVILKVREAF